MSRFNDHTPPGFALMIFRWFCKPEFREDIEGDLLERFRLDTGQKGIRQAQWLFIKEIFLLLRPNLMSIPSFHPNLLSMKNPNFLRLSVASILAIGSFCYLLSSNSVKKQSVHDASLNKATAFFPVTQQRIGISGPVSNKDWSDFLLFLQSDEAFSAEYIQSMLPDDWEKKHDNSPVLGVSWLQAGEFCKWKSVVTTYREANSKDVVFSEMLEKNQLAKKHITYRLPTESEWNTLVKTKKVMGSSGFLCVVSKRG